MLQIVKSVVGKAYRSWVGLLISIGSGLLYAVALPPFNQEWHPLLAPLPLLSFVVLIPLLCLAVLLPLRRAVLHSLLFGVASSLVQYFWIGFVTAEGLWHLILLGVSLICLLFGTYTLVAAMVFRLLYRRLPSLYLLVFPAFWVLLEWSRTLGEISFPWMFLGYTLVPLAPLAQLASVCGVYGLSALVVLGNLLIARLLWSRGAALRGELRWVGAFALVLVVGALWGTIRLYTHKAQGPSARLACVQANLNQFDTGPQLLDTAVVRQERLSLLAAQQRPDCIVMAESALLTYLDRRPGMRRMVQGWSNQAQSPIIVGSLHWEAADSASQRQYNVYNTAFFVKPDEPFLERYFKIKLVPFSETLPFEGLFPMLSRINLGESDFKAGSKPVTFRIGDSIAAVPFVCYEIIYPGFVRSRLDSTATTLVNITNDGWFGRTSGPFHHAAMARMRCIENGISLVRCANSGISMLVDPLGRVISKTKLYEQTLLIGEVPLQRVSTLYTRLGEWPVGASGFIMVLALALLILRRGMPAAPSSDDESASAER